MQNASPPVRRGLLSAAQAGRNGDTESASPRGFVLPRHLQTDEVMHAIAGAASKAGIDPNQFYDGHAAAPGVDPKTKEAGERLRALGRGTDTLLAHINPAEARLLDRVTDGGSINPRTGLPEFESGGEGGNGSAGDGNGSGAGGNGESDGSGPGSSEGTAAGTTPGTSGGYGMAGAISGETDGTTDNPGPGIGGYGDMDSPSSYGNTPGMTAGLGTAGALGAIGPGDVGNGSTDVLGWITSLAPQTPEEGIAMLGKLALSMANPMVGFVAQHGPTMADFGGRGITGAISGITGQAATGFGPTGGADHGAGPQGSGAAATGNGTAAGAAGAGGGTGGEPAAPYTYSYSVAQEEDSPPYVIPRRGLLTTRRMG
jgi:hypothetical protein